MENVESLREAADKLPKALKDNAYDLLDRMTSVVEGIGDGDMKWHPPFLKLIQPTTGETPDGATVGSLVIGDRVLTKKKGEPLSVIPLRMWHSRQYWDPDPNNPIMLCNSPDSKVGYKYGNCKGCQFAEWVEGEGSACNRSKTFIAITSDFSDIVQISFTKGQYKNGNAWETLMKRASVSPYKRIYDLVTAKHSKAPTYVINVEPNNGERPDAKAEEFLVELFNRISADREAQLNAFYDNIKNNQQAIENNQRAAIEHQADDETVVEVEAVEDDGGAKDYQI